MHNGESLRPVERFSPEFDALIKGGTRVKRYLKENGINTAWSGSEKNAWEYWKKGRQPIARIMDELAGPEKRSYSVFDMGCANGFLLRCLQEWSGRAIEPYGMDSRASKVRNARRMFPGREDHFAEGTSDPDKLPGAFDFVYWNAWDNYDFSRPNEVALFEKLLRKAGKLVVGFYDQNQHDRHMKIERLRELGYAPLGIREGATTQTFAWYQGSGMPEMAVENRK